MSCICPEKVVCGKMGVVGKDGDVEMLRFRKVRRKERAKMKQVGSATNARMQGCKDAKRSKNSCRILHSGQRGLSKAQQGVG